ncbi:putative glucarate dehydratase [Streptomyces viridochromogenes Tue57]|uniref:Putative glucarate dehydratase n=1 Tax=Streptomyces viridochromogenes Tue57 TaxID=1160705 RepID=L8P4H9_STRVR|nr:putative glucarate dehydratase [Streptomyces viridochromogenes Tue57]
MRRTRELAAFCEAFGIALSMHSHSHPGISLAAVIHVATALPRLDHCCDTRHPWNSADDVITPGALEPRDGAVRVPAARESVSNSTTTPLTGCTGRMSSRRCAPGTTPGICGGSIRSTSCDCRAGDGAP